MDEDHSPRKVFAPGCIVRPLEQNAKDWAFKKQPVNTLTSLIGSRYRSTLNRRHKKFNRDEKKAPPSILPKYFIGLTHQLVSFWTSGLAIRFSWRVNAAIGNSVNYTSRTGSSVGTSLASLKMKKASSVNER